MSRVKTTITGPDGKVTTIVTQRSGCGCLTALAVVVVLFGPAAWFPLPLAVVAYILLAALVVAGAVRWISRRRTPATPVPPPVPGA
jgi:hypothetical protein